MESLYSVWKMVRNGAKNGATDAEIADFIASEGYSVQDVVDFVPPPEVQPETAPSSPDTGRAGAFVRALTSGLTLGLDEPVGAALAAGSDPNLGFGQARDLAQAQEAERRAEYPWTSLAGNIAGGVAPAMLAGAALPGLFAPSIVARGSAAAKAGAPVTSLLGRIGQYAKTGFSQSLLADAPSERWVKDPAGSAGRTAGTATVGTIAAPVLGLAGEAAMNIAQPAGGMAKNATRKIAELLHLAKPSNLPPASPLATSKGAKSVAETLSRYGTTPTDIAGMSRGGMTDLLTGTADKSDDVALALRRAAREAAGTDLRAYKTVREGVAPTLSTAEQTVAQSLGLRPANTAAGTLAVEKGALGKIGQAIAQKQTLLSDKGEQLFGGLAKQSAPLPQELALSDDFIRQMDAVSRGISGQEVANAGKGVMAAKADLDAARQLAAGAGKAYEGAAKSKVYTAIRVLEAKLEKLQNGASDDALPALISDIEAQIRKLETSVPKGEGSSLLNQATEAARNAASRFRDLAAARKLSTSNVAPFADPEINKLARAVKIKPQDAIIPDGQGGYKIRLDYVRHLRAMAREEAKAQSGSAQFYFNSLKSKLSDMLPPEVAKAEAIYAQSAMPVNTLRDIRGQLPSDGSTSGELTKAVGKLSPEQVRTLAGAVTPRSGSAAGGAQKVAQALRSVSDVPVPSAASQGAQQMGVEGERIAADIGGQRIRKGISEVLLRLLRGGVNEKAESAQQIARLLTTPEGSFALEQALRNLDVSQQRAVRSAVAGALSATGTGVATPQIGKAIFPNQER